jgi:hypothetical protein
MPMTIGEITRAFQLLQQLADFRQFFRGDVLRLHGPQHELARRPAERFLDYVIDDLLLGLFFRNGRGIKLGPSRLIAFQQPLVEHDLHHLQGRRVSRVAITQERIVNIAN